MRVNQVAAEFRKVSNKQMAETTKRTIRENVSINAQLGKMSDKTLELIQVHELSSMYTYYYICNMVSEKSCAHKLNCLFPGKR